MNEFALIKRYFERPDGAAYTTSGDSGVVLGIGDDCAIISPDSDEETVITTDTLVAGVHFPERADPQLIAQRALRINLSDIAAMGAQPRWFLLALTLPELDEAWLEAFSLGLREVADHYHCVLMGGDTTRGPLTITITMLGTVPRGKALVRRGAQVGDAVYITGCLGDAAAGLRILQGGFVNDELTAADAEYLLSRYWQPAPRISEGLMLRDFASAAIDISDGLLADLGHISAASGVAAELATNLIPVSDELTKAVDEQELMATALTAGDDYELCFTVPLNKVASLESQIDAGILIAKRLGDIVSGSGVMCRNSKGQICEFADAGYQHF